MNTLPYVALLLIVGATGSMIARKLSIPGGGLLGAMFATAVMTLLAPSPQELPLTLRNASLILLGCSTGATVTREGLLRIRRCAPAALAGIGVLLFTATIVGLEVNAVAGGDASLLTIMLGTLPGGASGLAAAAYDMGAEASLVASMHMVRQFIVFGTLPLVLRALVGRGKVSHAGHDHGGAID